MQIQIRAAVPEDVIAHAWYSLGYRPTSSLVFVPADRPIRRAGLVLRANLPPPAHPRALVHLLARRVADRLMRYGSRSAVLLVASERALQAPPVRLIRSLRTGLRHHGIALREVVGVTRRGFRSLGCHDRRCCPRSGHPLAAVTASRVAIMHALAGDTVAEDHPDAPTRPANASPPAASPPTEPPDDAAAGGVTRGTSLDASASSAPDASSAVDSDAADAAPDPSPSVDLGEQPGVDLDAADPGTAPDGAVPGSDPGPEADPSPDPPARGVTGTDAAAQPSETAASPSRGADPPPTGTPSPPGPARRSPMSAGDRDGWWRVWTKAIATGELSPELRAGFAAALADPALRNGVLATAMGATADARGPTAIPGWRRAMETPPEDLDLVTCAACVVVLALLEAPPGERADGLAVLAALTWYAGNPVGARRLAVTVLRERRGHGLASTLLALVLTGTPPPWARSRRHPHRRGGTDPQGGDLPHDPPGC